METILKSLYFATKEMNERMNLTICLLDWLKHSVLFVYKFNLMKRIGYLTMSKRLIVSLLLKIISTSSRFFENQPRELLPLWKGVKGHFFGPEKLQNHANVTNEGKGKLLSPRSLQMFTATNQVLLLGTFFSSTIAKLRQALPSVSPPSLF